MATISWISLADGLWTVGSNWSGGTVPGFLDLAVLNYPDVVDISTGVDAAATAIGPFTTIDLTSGGSYESFRARWRARA